MTDFKPSQEFLDKLVEVENLISKGLEDFLKNGKFTKNIRHIFFQVYNIIEYYSDEKFDSYIYDLYKKLIWNYATILSTLINNQRENSQISDVFIEQCNKMDLFIAFMTKCFSFLDLPAYAMFKNQPKILEIAYEIYTNIIFIPFQKKITDEVNILLGEDRRGNKDHRNKIKRILEIMRAMDRDIEEKKTKVEPKKEKPEKEKEKKEEKKEKNEIIENKEDNKIEEKKEEKKEEEKKEEEKKEEKKEEKEEKPAKTPFQDYWFNLFKEDTRQFIRNKAKTDIKDRSTPEYVFMELKFVEEENNRQTELINKRFYKRLNDIIYEEIIGTNMRELINKDSGVKYMLENDKYEELHNLYKLFQLYKPSLYEIANIFGDFIIKKGNALRKNETISRDPKKFVPELINLLDESNKLIADCFEENGILKKGKADSLSELMRDKYYQKQLAFYLDYCMRSGFNGKSEEIQEKTLNNIFELYKSIDNKIIFMLETNKKMRDRLIKDISLSISNEQKIVTELRNKDMKENIRKMENMIIDYYTSKTEGDSYKQSPSKGEPNGIILKVKIIRAHSWNIEKPDTIKFNLPKYFSSCLNDFENYYNKKHSQRKLIWCLIFSKVEIKYLYLNNISISSLPQILILLELEKSGTLSIKKLAEILDCKEALIKESIEGLILNPSFNKKQNIDQGVIIPTTTTEKDFNPNDEFKINMNFSHGTIMFNTIPMPKKKTPKEEKNKEEEEKFEIKKYQDNIIQATIVRIMKGKNGSAQHEWLVREVSRQIELFTAQPQQIKENIEKVMEKGLIKRE